MGVFSFYTFISYVLTSFLKSRLIYLTPHSTFIWMSNKQLKCNVKNSPLIPATLNKFLSFPSQLKQNKKPSCKWQMLEPNLAFIFISFLWEIISDLSEIVWHNISGMGALLINTTKLPWSNLPPSLTWIIVVGSSVIPVFCPYLSL